MYSDSSHWRSVKGWMIYNKLSLNTSERVFNSKCCHMLEEVVQEDSGVSLLALADPPLCRRAGLQTQVFHGFINAKCQKREGYVCLLAFRLWCRVQSSFEEFQQEVLVSQSNWCSCKLMDSARVTEINKDSLGIRLSSPGQPPQMQQLLNRLQNERLFAKNNTPEWFWAHLNLALRTTIKKQGCEFHRPRHIAIKQLIRSFYKEHPKASSTF